MLELQTLDPRTISSWQIPCREDEDSHNDDDGDDDDDDDDDGDGDGDVMNRNSSLESPVLLVMRMIIWIYNIFSIGSKKNEVFTLHHSCTQEVPSHL